jgi:hypothetical protein
LKVCIRLILYHILIFEKITRFFTIILLELLIHLLASNHSILFLIISHLILSIWGIDWYLFWSILGVAMSIFLSYFIWLIALVIEKIEKSLRTPWSILIVILVLLLSIVMMSIISSKMAITIVRLWIKRFLRISYLILISFSCQASHN